MFKIPGMTFVYLLSSLVIIPGSATASSNTPKGRLDRQEKIQLIFLFNHYWNLNPSPLGLIPPSLTTLILPFQISQYNYKLLRRILGKQ